ncbi:MAG: hypothetical protein H0X51_04330 [Parachlamydiaceae bacterium]|nr:hypothetical protein [Parachlamydiaceae bacterium]
MCFSATASFTTAIVLTVTGYFTLRTIKNRRQLMLALIPFLFAAQQSIEGIFWLTSSDPTEFEHTVATGKYFYLFFAFIVWPMWIPLSLLCMEENRRPFYWLTAFSVIGTLYSLTLIVLLFFIWPSQSISVAVVNQSIQYDFPFSDKQALTLIYLIPTVVSPLFSTYKWIWILGIANAIGCYIALSIYANSFVSVWCFFAAWVSICLYFILRNSKPLNNNPQRP